MHLRACLMLLVASSACNAQTVETRWRHLEGPHAHLTEGQTVGDFDGDGLDEIAFLTRDFFFDIQPRGIAVVDDPGTAMQWSQVVHGAGELDPQLFTAPRTGGDRIVVARNVQMPGGIVRELVSYGDDPLREVAAMQLSGSNEYSKVLAVGDLDGDGQTDFLEIHTSMLPIAPQLRARRLDTGAVLWWQMAEAHVGVTLASLDADPALEIIYGSPQGRVIDGASGLEEWAYAGGFNGPVRAGNFDAQPGDREFALLRGDEVVVFQANPYSPVFDRAVPCCGSQLAAADFDGDGVDEWLIGGSSVSIVEPSDGTSVSVETPDAFPTSIDVAAADADLGVEIVVNGVYGAVSQIRVIDGTSLEVEFAHAGGNIGGFPMVVDDLEGNGGSQIAFVVVQGNDRIVRVLDAQSGAMLRSTILPELATYSDAPPVLDAVQLDADPALELVLAQGDGAEAAAVVIDALSFERMYAIAPDVLGTPRAVAAGDIDADGTPELVFLSSEPRVHVFDGGTGAPRWTSIALDGGGGLGLALHDIDTDPALEMLASNGRDVYAFDGATRLLDWSISAGQGSDTMLVFERDASCRVALYGMTRYLEFACGGAVVDPPVDSNRPLTRILPRPLGANGLLAVSDGVLVRFDTGEGGMTVLAEPVGKNAGFHPQTAVVTESGDVILGNDGMVTRVELVQDGVFSDGFES